MVLISFGVSSSTRLTQWVLRLAHPIVGVPLLAGLTFLSASVNANLSAHSFEVLESFPLPSIAEPEGASPTAQTAHFTENNLLAQSAQATRVQPIEDGVYLYGQSPERDQIGSAYMVFEVTQGEVIGAFYMPRSSFDCFYGSLQADRIALTVIDSYERTPHPYVVALEPTDTLATTETEPTPVGLEGFHAIEAPSENDLRILSTCRADFQ